MPTDKIFSGTIFALEKSLNLRSLQHRVLASNIANMDTPNYKAVEIAIAEEMSRNQDSARAIQLRRTKIGHLTLKHNAADSVKLKVAKPPEFNLRGDGNTVRS